MKKSTLKALLAVLGTGVGYAISKHTRAEDTFPYVILGGFAGTFLGEEFISEDKKPIVIKVAFQPEAYAQSGPDNVLF